MSRCPRLLTAALLLASPVPLLLAGEPSALTLADFDRYTRAAEARIESEIVRREGFFHIDTLPAEERARAQAALARDEVYHQRLTARDGAGRELGARDGLIHHWLGAVLVRGASLGDVQAVVQDYDWHREYYSGDVLRSKTLAHQRHSGPDGPWGEDFSIFLQFRKKKVVTVVLDTEHDARYVAFGPCRLYCRSESTRVAEVEDSGKPAEREKPPERQGGFLWRINSYWRFEERDGGVLVECESVSLTRDIPAAVRWLVGPFVTSVPIESLRTTLERTRVAARARRRGR